MFEGNLRWIRWFLRPLSWNIYIYIYRGEKNLWISNGSRTSEIKCNIFLRHKKKKIDEFLCINVATEVLSVYYMNVKP